MIKEIMDDEEFRGLEESEVMRSILLESKQQVRENTAEENSMTSNEIMFVNDERDWQQN